MAKDENKPELKEVKKSRAKKLTLTQMQKEADKVRGVKKVKLDIGGHDYFYDIDTNPTTSRKADFIQNVKAIVAYTATEPQLEYLRDSDTEMFVSAMVLAELLNVFSSLEVGDTIEEKVNFIATASDLNILGLLTESIPETLTTVLHEANEAVSQIVEDMNEQAKEIQNKIIDLEQAKIEKTETEGE